MLLVGEQGRREGRHDGCGLESGATLFESGATLFEDRVWAGKMGEGSKRRRQKQN